MDKLTLKTYLVLPVNELQVDGASRAEKAVGFGLDVSSSERGHSNLEPLYELKDK